MKILFLQDDFPPQSFGGAGISTYELAVGLKKAGHEVFVITTCRKESDAGELEYDGLKVFRIASDYPGRWRTYVSLYNGPVVRQVEKLLKKIQPDVMHAHNIHFYLSYHCLKLGAKHVKAVAFTARDAMSVSYGKLGTRRYLDSFDCRMTWRDHIRQAKKRWNPLRNFIIKRYLGYTHKIFAVSNSLKKALEQNGIKNVEVMHTGADLDLWSVNEDEKMRFRERYNLENKKVILFGGRLSEAKGGGKTLEAMVEIAKDIPDAVLLVAGSIDGYANHMKDQANKLGIGDRLIFTGWLELGEMKLAHAVADITLVPSLHLDAFPRTVIEAMVSGKPVVGTCYGGASEIIDDGATGYVVNPFHPEEIVEKILDLLKNPKKAEKFGKAGYERVKAEFNLEDKVVEHVAIYKNIIGREGLIIGQKDGNVRYHVKNTMEKLLIFMGLRHPAKGVKISRDRKVDTLLSYKDGRNIFVETGTRHGYTIDAMRDSFEEIYSIEINTEKFNKATLRFADTEKVHLYHGDSAEKIYEVMRDIKEPALIWLDAHDVPFDLENSPVREELDAVFNHTTKGHIVLIDDARHFSMGDIREIKRIARSHKYDCVINEGIFRLTPKKYAS